MADDRDFAASTPQGHEDQGLPETFKAGNSQPQVNRGRRNRRTRAEVEAQRQKLKSEVESGLDALVAEMHLLLPRSKARVIGTAYARYSTDFQSSVLDQIRAIYERAITLGIFIPRECVFFDLAVPGCKERRPGLDQVKAVLDARAATVLLVFTTNRLYRKSHKAMKFVDEEVDGRGLRAIFIRTGIDTAETDRWRLPLQVHALVDEMTSTMYAENIRASHEGLFINGYVVFTLPYGYMGQDVPGQFTKRQRPRQIIIIDEELAQWVRQIFHWYVVDRMIKQRILERLNALKVPCGPKSDGSYWTDQALTYLLTNECYRGLWSYGKGKNVWQPKADYSKRVLRDKPLRQQHFEHLRLVSDEIWYGAQKLLAESAAANPTAGRKPVDGNKLTRPRILNGLFFCSYHDCRLKVAGDHGQIMVCMRCRTLPKDQRPLYSQLNRAMALKCICNALAAEIRKDCGAIRQLTLYFRDDAEQLQAGDTGGIDRLRARVEKLTRQIQFVQSNPGESDADQAESAQNLKGLRSERAGLAAELARRQAAIDRPKRQPTEEELQELLVNFEQVLLTAALGKDPVDAGTLRALIELLTGGRIVMEQMGERRACRGWLRARFSLHLLETCTSRLDCTFLKDGAPAREIIVDIREETVAEQNAVRAVELYEGGMLVTGIASTLGIDRHQVTAALKIHCQRAGLPPPKDGRVRRAQLTDKLLNPPICQQISERVKQLMDQGLLMEQIAAAVGYTRDTVREALRYWYQQRGLPMPDMRNRRKELEIKNRPRKDLTEP